MRLDEQDRDEVDEFIDDLFGEADEGGPGRADAVLLVGGMAALVGGVVFGLPNIVLVAGMAALALGSILPIRSLFRRVRGLRRESKTRTLLDDGMLLDAAHPALAELVKAHDQVLRVTKERSLDPGNRVNVMAHGLIREVASLLVGEPPVDQSEVDYIAARTNAMVRLAEVSSRGSAGEDDRDFRLAALQARLEVESIAGGSALTEASKLLSDLDGLGDDPEA